MLFAFNGIYKDDNIIVDAILIEPNDYDLDEKYIWFIVDLHEKNKVGLNKSDFIFYLLDKNKCISNPVSVLETPDSDNTTKYNITVFIGFEAKTDYFYEAPMLCFYYIPYKKTEFINLSY